MVNAGIGFEGPARRSGHVGPSSPLSSVRQKVVRRTLYSPYYRFYDHRPRHRGPSFGAGAGPERARNATKNPDTAAPGALCRSDRRAGHVLCGRCDRSDEMHRTGKIRMLSLTNPTRRADAPDIPTVAGQGFQDRESGSIAKTPRAIISIPDDGNCPLMFRNPNWASDPAQVIVLRHDEGAQTKG